MFTAPDGNPASVSYSSTMDMSIIKEIFSIFVSAAEVIGKSEDELVQKVQKTQPRLLPTEIARDGSIMEWAEDFADPEPHHRHVPHLFGRFPGHTITVEHAYRMVKHLFDLVDPDNESNYEGGLYSNLFTAHPPFQMPTWGKQHSAIILATNVLLVEFLFSFSFPAVVSEMLVQSTLKDLYLLPTLHTDKWANGCVKGLKARGGVTVSICWKEGDLHEVGLWTTGQNSLHGLHYR